MLEHLHGGDGDVVEKRVAQARGHELHAAAGDAGRIGLHENLGREDLGETGFFFGPRGGVAGLEDLGLERGAHELATFRE